MIRLLLTFLALLTGLAAEVSPAQAAIRHADETEVGSLQQFVAAGRKTVDIADLATDGAVFGGAVQAVQPVPQPSPRTPAVLIGIDRSRQ